MTRSGAWPDRHAPLAVLPPLAGVIHRIRHHALQWQTGAQLQVAQLQVAQLQVAQLQVAQLQVAQLQVAQLQAAEELLAWAPLVQEQAAQVQSLDMQGEPAQELLVRLDMGHLEELVGDVRCRSLQGHGPHRSARPASSWSEEYRPRTPVD